TVIADHASAMVRAAELIEDVPAGTHRLLIAPASNPTLGEIAEHTSSLLGQKSKRPISVPRWVTRSAGVAERYFFELNRLAPILYSPCVIAPGELAAEVGTTDWREGVAQMLCARANDSSMISFAAIGCSAASGAASVVLLCRGIVD